LTERTLRVRIVCGIEYDGTGYNGWQRQSHRVSVQAVVESALAFVADHPVTVVCAGRTDAHVHATWQVIHFDTAAQRSVRSWVLGANSRLPDDVRLLWACQVDDRFHARFSALSRQYRYVILNRPVASALKRNHASWIYKPLDSALMAAGGEYLLGEHDFSTFRAVACQAKNPVRTIRRLEVSRDHDYVYIDVEANAFLHHMVRNIAGVLISVGSGEHQPAWVAELLDFRDRTQGGITAPAQGLYLVGVGYPDNYAIGNVGYLPHF